MEKFISYKKLSKAKQRELNRQQRGSWGDVNPVTRTVKDRKAYDRKRDKRVKADEY